MELARISAKSEAILFGPVRLDDMIWQAKESVKKSNPEFSFLVDTSSLPENAEDLIINANDALIKTAFINLFENACKYSVDQKALIKINTDMQHEIAIEIKDTRQVIPEAEKEQIFKTFYRSNVNNSIKGSGIDL